MSDKSYVSLEQKVCPITGKTFDTNSILMDTRLKDSFDKYTVTGWEICPEVQQQLDKGFVALVEIDEEKSSKRANGRYKPEDVYRTGNICYLKTEAFKNIFNVELNTPFVFVDENVISKLNSMIDDN